MPFMNQRKPEWLERTIAGLCYLSSGLIGLLYIIISGTRNQSEFFRFHFLQSILLCVFGFLLNFTFGIMLKILGGIAGLCGGAQMAGVVFGYVQMGVTLVLDAGFLLLIYGLVFALMGKFAEIPIVSRMVRRNMGSF